MQQTMGRAPAASPDAELSAAFPLYVASLLVTMAGVGAVGVTITANAWTPVWVLLAVVGHGVSILLRQRRLTPDNVFWPVMLVGLVILVQLYVSGSPLTGLDAPITMQQPDMATAILIGSLAVLRSFTLVTNASLLFSPVPAITMLALVASSNPNAEVPVFFSLALLGSLFITGYEAHLRRMAQIGRSDRPLTFHLLASWCFALLVCTIALVAPFLIQPVLSQYSPFSLPSLRRMTMNFTRENSSRAPVGQGPILLTQTPVYEVYTDSNTKLRTGVLTDYDGREWKQEAEPLSQERRSTEEVTVRPPQPGIMESEVQMYRFKLPEGTEATRKHRVRQYVVTRGYVPEGVPAPGRIVELDYPASQVTQYVNGCVSGRPHQANGNVLQITSEVLDADPTQLRQAPSPGSEAELQAEALALPESADAVRPLAQQVTRGRHNNYDRVQAILQYIAANCSYTLQEEYTPPGEDAAVHYLFVSKRGACDLAATAMTVMCRAVGIPSRVAIGYVLEERLPGGDGFMVRQAHAHMWTEVYFPKYGWIAFDPAPSLVAIQENPVRLAWYKLHDLVAKIGGGGLDAWLLILVVVLTVVLTVAAVLPSVRRWWERRRRLHGAVLASPEAAVAREYGQALAVLAKRGWARAASLTPREFLETMRREWGARDDASAALRALEELTSRYEEACYAGGEGPELIEAAARAARELARVAPARRRSRKLAPAPTGSAA